MAKSTTNILLAAALTIPVAAFWLLFSKLGLGALLAGAISVASGWGLNLGWAKSADPDGKENYPAIALRFGWLCPAVLVLATWAALRFLLGSAA